MDPISRRAALGAAAWAASAAAAWAQEETEQPDQQVQADPPMPGTDANANTATASSLAGNAILFWHDVALELNALDHSIPLSPGIGG